MHRHERNRGQAIATGILAALLTAGHDSAHAAAPEAFPAKPIRIITAQAGGGNDFAARIIAQGLTTSLGRTVIVENRGGSVVVASEILMHAQPDAYTLLLYGNNLWLLPFMRESVRYDVMKDFAPVSLAVSSPNVLVVPPVLPVKSARELIALAKSKPGELNFGAATGGLAHIAAELFKSMAGIRIVHVAYKGGAPALTDLMAGQLQMVFPTAGAVAPHLHSGRLRALGVTSAKPSALLPDIPTIAATGLPGYESVSQFALFAPRGTPQDRVELLSREIAKAVQSPEAKQRFHGAGIEPVGTTPAGLTAVVRTEMGTLGKVIRDAGIRADAPQ